MPLKGLRAISRYILLAGGFLIVIACALIVVEIVMRQVFRRSLGGVDELAGFALAVGTAWSFGAVLLDKAHVRIDTVYSHFGDKGRALFDILSLTGTVLFMSAMLYFATEVLTTSIRFGASSQSSLAIPKSVPQAMWVAGLGWFLLVAVILLCCCLAALFRGDWKQVGRLAGAPDIETELSAELADTEQRNAGEKGAQS
ncbi:TRAP transporter small permease subunit [Oryzicola mucosus]|uniref:TRAP transporter small permease protein n=1 Tax=Oryzicola mucosus TaxID=2767425 RepID=A0A8J6PSH7_9HYPH|nr:TRAP transporter small permease [Oryzicola mucosus]MBD0413191.1 TRAP transporter small permease [Oryzicola mucosus]